MTGRQNSLALFALALLVLVAFVASQLWKSDRRNSAGLAGPEESPPDVSAPRSERTPESSPGQRQTPVGPNQNAEAQADRPAPADALLAAQADLAQLIDGSLDGILSINDTLDQVLAFASLPVSDKVDFDYGSDEVAAYKILGTPPGTTAHFLVGLNPIVLDDQQVRYFQMEIQMNDGEQEFNRNAMRDGPRIHLSLDYGDDQMPHIFNLTTQRRVSLSASRAAGIDAYHGEFTTGASFHVKLSDPGNPMSETHGIVDGNPSRDQFQAISPLHGANDLDPQKVELLLSKFLHHLENNQ